MRKVVLFRIGTPAGFVSHAAPHLLRQQLAIASGPLLISTGLAAALFTMTSRLLLLQPAPWWLAAALCLFWLGWSVALEAWPSGGDAAALHQSAMMQLRRVNPVAVLALLIAWLLLLTNASRRLGGHWLYAIALCWLGWRLSGG